MERDQEAGIFFGIRDLKVLFPVLKRQEGNLDGDAEFMLHNIEKLLYDHLSIREFEMLISRSDQG